MNKLTLTTFLLMCFALSSAFSQRLYEDISIKISESEGKGLAEGHLGVVGTTDDGFYVLRIKGSSALGLGQSMSGNASLYVDKYTNDLKRKQTAFIEGVGMAIVGRSRGSVYEFATQDEDQNLYVFFSEYVKGVNSLYSLKLDDDRFEFVDEQLIYSDRKANKRLDRRGTYAIVESEDRNKFAVYSFTNERFGRNSEIYAETFNRKMESEWKMYEVVESYQRGNVTNAAFQTSTHSSARNKTFSISLSNNGVMNVMQKIYDDSFANLFGANNYFHQIYTLSGQSGRLEYTIFDNEEKFIVEAMIRHDQNDNLNLVGYVGDRERLIDGVIFRSMDPLSFNTVKEKIINFSSEQKKEFLVSQDDGTRKNFGDKRTERRLDKGKRVNISARNNLIDVFVHEDNSITIAGEYFDVITTTTNRGVGVGAQSQQTTDYIFGDLKFVNVSEDGKIRWVKNIHKYQRSSSMNLLSVSSLFLDNKINFIFNDFQQRKLMYLSIDQDGNYNPYEIADLGRRGELENHWFLPSSVRYLNENEIVGFANRLLRTKIIKIGL